MNESAAGNGENGADGSLKARVRAVYDGMAPAERRVADLILHFPGELHGYAATELARLAGTSNAAVSRFVRRLGFASFEEMRLFARQESENGSPVTLMRLHAGADPGPYDLARHAEMVGDNLQHTVAGIDPALWAGLIEAAAQAPHVWINGFRHGFHLAGYLKWSLGHVRENVALIPGAGETFGESLVEARAGDLAILFAMRRRVPATARLARALQHLGVRVALITDAGMADTLGAEFVLRCHSRSRGATDDHASAFILAHALIEGLIHRLGDPARARFAVIDERHAALAEFG
ncbi:MAG TPA: MurR/RpiR family transcriptional regulator [Xanthobacteraceae bacterium]|nr:MurR/RpiR family transcriptional regulator [Xanthobacteraceae bacterium]